MSGADQFKQFKKYIGAPIGSSTPGISLNEVRQFINQSYYFDNVPQIGQNGVSIGDLFTTASAVALTCSTRSRTSLARMMSSSTMAMTLSSWTTCDQATVGIDDAKAAKSHHLSLAFSIEPSDHILHEIIDSITEAA